MRTMRSIGVALAMVLAFFIFMKVVGAVAFLVHYFVLGVVFIGLAMLGVVFYRSGKQ